MTHTPWQAGTTIAQDFTLRRALSRGANFEPCLADGPDASASYIVHRLTPRSRPVRKQADCGTQAILAS